SPYAPQHTAHVMKVLAEIGADQTRQILVLNKMDQAGGAEESGSLAQRILDEVPGPVGAKAIAISARTGAGFELLLTSIDAGLALDPVSRSHFRIPASEGSAIHLLHEGAKVLSTRYQDEWCEIDAEAPESVRRRLNQYVFE